MEAVLEDNGLKEFVDNDILKPRTVDAKNLVDWNNCVSKARRIILEGVRDHIVSNIDWKETPYEMWQALMINFKI